MRLVAWPPTPPAGIWFCPSARTGSLNEMENLLDNEVYYYPFAVTRNVTVDLAGVISQPNSTPTNGHAQVGIYSHDAANFRPDVLLGEVDLTLDNATGGRVPHEGSLSSAVSLKSRTVYWIAFAYRNDSGGGSGHSIARRADVHQLQSIWGSDVADDVVSGSSSGWGWTHIENSFSEGWTTLPATYDATGESLHKTGLYPMAFLKVSAGSSDVYGPGYGPPFAIMQLPAGEDQFLWLGASKGTTNLGAQVIRDAFERRLEDRLFYWPITPPHDIRLTEIGVEVSTSAAGDVNCAIYEDDGSNQPGALVVEMGSLSTSTTGEKSTAIDVTLTGQTRYWVAWTYVGASGVGFRGFVDDYGSAAIEGMFPIGSPDLEQMGGDNAGAEGQPKAAPTHFEITGRASVTLSDPADVAGMVRATGRDAATNREGGLPSVFVKWAQPTS